MSALLNKMSKTQKQLLFFAIGILAFFIAKYFKLVLTLPLALVGLAILLLPSCLASDTSNHKNSLFKLGALNIGLFCIISSLLFSVFNLFKIASIQAKNHVNGIFKATGSYVDNAALWIPDAELGYRYKPNSQNITSGRFVQKKGKSDSKHIIYDVIYNIDSDGNRQTLKANFGYKSNTGNAYFAGGSFMFGEGLNDEDTLPSHFAKLTNIHSVNLGMHGYGPHQALKMIENDSFNNQRIDFDKIKYFIYRFIPEHIKRAAGYASWDPNGPCYDVDEGSQSLTFMGSFADCKSSPDLKYIYQIMSKSSEPITKEIGMKQLNAKFYSKGYEAEDIARFILILNKMTNTIVGLGGAPIYVLEDYQFNSGSEKCIADDHLYEQILPFLDSRAKVVRVSEIIQPSNCKASQLTLSHQYDHHPSSYLNQKIADYIAHRLL